MPKRAISLIVMSMYGFEISSPSTSTTATPLLVRTSGSVISSAVRNWLDTSPRTRIGASTAICAGRIRSGG